MSEIRLEGVTKRFGDLVAIDDLSLTVEHGEFVVLLGPTGAGKTTTLRLVSGLEQPEQGRVSIAGTDVTRLPPAARDVAMVFQQYSLYPHYSVYDNLAFPLRSPLRRRPDSEIEARVREIAQLLRIDSKLKNRATQLSGGEMQRVAIGRALVREPSVFLMDEPLSSLDAKLREDLRVELKRIQMDLGATVLYVTHDQIEAMTLADRIGVLAEGRLIQIDSPQAIYNRPASLYVACRLGSPQINQLPMGALGLSQGPAGAHTLGLRPEDIVLDPADQAGGGAEARILSIESQGAETVVQLEAEGQRLLALAAPGQHPVPGETAQLRVAPESCLFFDASGARLPIAAETR